MSGELSIVGGASVTLDPRVVCQRTSFGVIVGCKWLPHVVHAEVDEDGAISSGAAESLIRNGFAYPEGTRLFDAPKLAAAVFSWDPWPEVERIRRLLGDACGGRGLDVGCGFGRLMLPFVKSGARLDGLDSSRVLLERLRSELPPQADARTLYGRMESVVVDRVYDYAFAALNSLRYVETATGLRRHFASMKGALAGGGRYVIGVTLTPQPTTSSEVEWAFELEGQGHLITWRRHDYCYLKRRLIEEIEIRRVSDNAVTHREYQAQAQVTSSTFASMPGWRLVDLVDAVTLEPVEVCEQTTGSVWAVLECD